MTATLKTARDLIEAGLVPAARAAIVESVGQRYAIAMTPELLSLVDPDDPHDPIARQFVPDERELERHALERDDPIGDQPHSPVKGLVHRYPDRVLLKIVGICPVYCRFCFRREMIGPAQQANLTADEVAAALAYVRAHPEIWEIILTGGDPFVLSPRRIADLMREIAAIEHVKIVRWHTRVPVASPRLVSDGLIQAMTSEGHTVLVALHTNHARELTADAKHAIRRLVASGISVLSQTVLLRGVNDDVATLEALMRALVEAGVKPYYLHHADLAPGTAHFRTTIETGQSLMRELRQRLPGHALPRYVLDIPGGYGKVPIGPAYLNPDGSVHDPGGHSHPYGNDRES